MPRTVSRNAHKRSGFSGFPKFKQFDRACGRAPTATRLRHTSSTAFIPPRYGSSAVYGPVDEAAIARPRHESTRGLTTAASPWAAFPITPWRGRITVDARTSWSYCRITYSFEATFGDRRIFKRIEVRLRGFAGIPAFFVGRGRAFVRRRYSGPRG